MPRFIAPDADRKPRKRRAHTKSRKGCGNCKLRQIKCDERKPTCKNCHRFGVLCNYGQQAIPGEGILQVAMNGPYQIGILPSPSAKTAVLGALNAALRREPFLDSQNPVLQLTNRDLDILTRFQFRTTPTLATTGSQDLYQREAIRLACLHPFLMHVALGITLAHDRHLESSPPVPPSTAELHHLYRGTAMFNKTLQGPLTSSERDAVWASGSLLTASALAQIDAKVPEQAWPLVKPTENDLTWIMVFDAKRELWRIANPSREDSCLRAFAEEGYFSLHAPGYPKPTLTELPEDVIQLLGLDGSDTNSDNPYRVPATTLDNILAMESSQSTVLCYLSFLCLMPHDFRSLLQQKDPYALILMAYWYAHFSQSRAWHIWRRCILECQAVCIYLGRHHGDILGIEKILEFSRRLCEVGTV
ncbi:unnamed protein product [Clonostachys solani]|uniref:Zn(2)-C6 fungal-type domain-containing protein n=1 Tax=Clonostachys solani TaxID=160281 RepID=A0A9P0EJD4_9HYPO|nr:unnamed protein product [Clonostachys solani]